MNTIVPSTSAPNWLQQGNEAKSTPLARTYAAMAVTAAIAIAQVPSNVQSWLALGLDKPTTSGAYTPYFESDIPDSRYTTTLPVEVRAWLTNSAQLSLVTIDHLVDVIFSVFGKVPLSSSLHMDPDEGWQKLVLTVDSGVEDLEHLMNLENKLFATIDSDQPLLNALSSVVISQV